MNLHIYFKTKHTTKSGRVIVKECNHTFECSRVVFDEQVPAGMSGATGKAAGLITCYVRKNNAHQDIVGKRAILNVGVHKDTPVLIGAYGDEGDGHWYLNFYVMEVSGEHYFENTI